MAREDHHRLAASTAREMSIAQIAARLSQMGWGIRLGVWLCGLPLALRLSTLPSLLQRLTPGGSPPTRQRDGAMDRVVQWVVWLCHRRPFRLQLFPRACLRQALALYATLTRMGYPVAIHIGVRQAEGRLYGHSWVTVHGQPVAERTRTDVFHIIYTYPPAISRAGHDEVGPFAGDRRAVYPSQGDMSPSSLQTRRLPWIKNPDSAPTTS
jgi:hypothetical protein